MHLSIRMTPLAVAIGSSLALGTVQAATITVDTLDDNLSEGACSLRAALASVNAQEALYGCDTPDGVDDEIVFGDLSGTIALKGEQLEILEPAIISGPGADLLKISGQGQSRVFLVQADSTISGLSISDGDPGTASFGEPGFDGGGVYLNDEYAHLTLEDCHLSGNSGTYGGGLAVGAGRAIVSRCEISGNSAGVMGGGAWVDASLNERAGSYMNEEFGYQAYARLDLVDSVVSGNESESWGGGLGAGRLVRGFGMTVPPPPGLEPVANLSQPSLSLVQTEVSGNLAGAGGGIGADGGLPVAQYPFFTALRNRIDIRNDSVIADNHAAYEAGGIVASNSDLLLQDTLVHANSLSVLGTGGIEFIGIPLSSVSPHDLTLEPQLVIQSSEISDNSTTEPPPVQWAAYILAVGGLDIAGGSHALDDVLITGNEGWHVGGIAFGRRTIGSVTRSQVANNSGRTGGVLIDILAQSDLSLTRIDDNQSHFVGGLSCNRGSDCQVRYSSIAGNAGEVGAVGADIHPPLDLPFPNLPPQTDETQVTIENSTISNNIGTRVGGIDADWLTLRFATVTSNFQDGEALVLQGEEPPEPPRPSAAGIVTDGSVSLIDHSIVSDNVSAMDHPDVEILSAALPVSFSVLGSVDPASVDALESVVQVSARLGPLEDNGSEWNLSHLPYPGSPAINAGDPDITDPPLFDQRGPGFDRIVDGRINIGAVEGTATGLPGQPVAVSTLNRVATGLLTGGFLLLAWLGLRRTPVGNGRVQ